MNTIYRVSRLCKLMFCIGIVLSLVHPFYGQDDQVDAAKQVTSKYLSATDKNDAQAAISLIGEEWTRTQSRAEILGGLTAWFNAKAGAGASRELVAQRTITEAQSHAMAPTSKAKGNVYYFRYRTQYPGGTFFEDLFVGRDSDGVLRIEGHHPLPA